MLPVQEWALVLRCPRATSFAADPSQTLALPPAGRKSSLVPSITAISEQLRRGGSAGEAAAKPLVLVTLEGSNKWRGVAEVEAVSSSSSYSFELSLRWISLAMPGPSQQKKDDLVPGLPFHLTEDLVLPPAREPRDAKPPQLNTARHGALIPANVARAVLDRLTAFLRRRLEQGEEDKSQRETSAVAADGATARRLREGQERKEHPGNVLFHPSRPGLSEAEEAVEVAATIQARLGTPLHLSYVGSRRYNLQLDGKSDRDYLCVFAAPTEQVLGLDGCVSQIANPEGIEPDVTAIEVGHFCKMLLDSDPRCIETLFIEEENLLPDTPSVLAARWAELRKMRDLFVTQALVEKLLRDAEGPQKLQLLLRVGAAEREPPEAKQRDRGLPDKDYRPWRHRKQAENAAFFQELLSEAPMLAPATASSASSSFSPVSARLPADATEPSASLPLPSSLASSLPPPASSSGAPALGPRRAKLWYLVFRLLHQAEYLQEHGTFPALPFPGDSRVRAFLMDVRKGRYGQEELEKRAAEALGRIRRMAPPPAAVPSNGPAEAGAKTALAIKPTPEAKASLDAWLVALRLDLLHFPRIAAS